MDAEELRYRTKKFAIESIEFCRTFSNNLENSIIKRQFIRSATSVGANYRAAGRARSKAEFHSKLCIVLEEMDESLYWLEIIGEFKLGESNQFDSIKKEAIELVKIFSVSRKTSNNN